MYIDLVCKFDTTSGKFDTTSGKFVASTQTGEIDDWMLFGYVLRCFQLLVEHYRVFLLDD